MSALLDLAERCERASGPFTSSDIQLFMRDSPWYHTHGTGDPFWSELSLALQGSIDAAVALCERVLPGCGWLIGRGRLKSSEPLYGATIHASDLTDMADDMDEIGGGEGPSPALALCAATLRALDAKGRP